MTNSVRFETRPSDGKERIRHHDGEAERYVYVHRLALFAWTPDMGVEDLWLFPDDEERRGRTDRLHAHHDVPVGWLNTERNLSWEDPRDHGRLEDRRRERGPDGAYAGPRVAGERAARAAEPD